MNNWESALCLSTSPLLNLKYTSICALLKSTSPPVLKSNFCILLAQQSLGRWELESESYGSPVGTARRPQSKGESQECNDIKQVPWSCPKSLRRVLLKRIIRVQIAQLTLGCNLAQPIFHSNLAQPTLHCNRAQLPLHCIRAWPTSHCDRAQPTWHSSHWWRFPNCLCKRAGVGPNTWASAGFVHEKMCKNCEVRCTTVWCRGVGVSLVL